MMPTPFSGREGHVGAHLWGRKKVMNISYKDGGAGLTGSAGAAGAGQQREGLSAIGRL